VEFENGIFSLFVLVMRFSSTSQNPTWQDRVDCCCHSRDSTVTAKVATSPTASVLRVGIAGTRTGLLSGVELICWMSHVHLQYANST